PPRSSVGGRRAARQWSAAQLGSGPPRSSVVVPRAARQWSAAQLGRGPPRSSVVVRRAARQPLGGQSSATQLDNRAAPSRQPSTVELDISARPSYPRAADGTSRQEIAPCIFQPRVSSHVLGALTVSGGSSRGPSSAKPF